MRGGVSLGLGDTGVNAYGNSYGSRFEDLNSSGYALVGAGDDGIRAYGDGVGGYFQALDGSGCANVGTGDIAKALESLEQGQATIRVVVMLR